MDFVKMARILRMCHARGTHSFASRRHPEDFMLEFYSDPLNSKDVLRRSNDLTYQRLTQICVTLQNSSPGSEDYDIARREFLKLPNRTHPNVLKNESSDPVVLRTHMIDSHHQAAKNFDVVSRRSNVLLMDEHLTQLCGERSYVFLGDLVKLERALVQFTVKMLKARNFLFVSVPDILDSDILESCGMNPNGERSQIYKVKLGEKSRCLSGTAEMALGHLIAYLPNLSSLPIRLAALSRCYRAEISNIKSEKGLYRVHQFNKVEMFGVTHQDDEASEALLEEFVSIQEHIFSSLGLSFKVLEMPVEDLALPAYRKVDIEAFMPGHKRWGELSSASNCTEYQATRFGLKGVHTCNGTACAIPRTLIAICEQYQTSDNKIRIPDVLRPYMENRTHLDGIPNLKFEWMPYYYLENLAIDAFDTKRSDE